MSTRPLDQTKNDRDLKFDEHTPLDYNLLSKKVFFVFFKKATQRAVNFENMPRHMDSRLSPQLHF